MKISKKCQYALKAVFELAWRNTGKPVKIREIADAQRISPRFMEVILNELKHGGFVESKRGNEGGYTLARDAKDLTVREVIEYIQGPISLVPNGTKAFEGITCFGDEAFKEFWQELNNVVSEACDNKTFADLVGFEQAKRQAGVPNYII